MQRGVPSSFLVESNRTDPSVSHRRLSCIEVFRNKGQTIFQSKPLRSCAVRWPDGWTRIPAPGFSRIRNTPGTPERLRPIETEKRDVRSRRARLGRRGRKSCMVRIISVTQRRPCCMRLSWICIPPSTSAVMQTRPRPWKSASTCKKHRKENIGLFPQSMAKLQEEAFAKRKYNNFRREPFPVSSFLLKFCHQITHLFASFCA